ncbi:Alpha/beta-Hydrolases superfamily protein isoform 1 [Cucumis melo var. makuwa]|uniref:Alpha/beta-Hydrolases superfamily protein isoform 1 n=1 Tax=Cucumis melo var. makuwa TaxID=1194695 RepID=A0A5D3BMN2_CUCMM|nr:Alpha/beta-Hydrolases superfamily protein isoform 1 [Cucumis melo var. makuwa]
MKAPPPKTIYGLANGPPLTSPRVKLHDGRHLAYKELGVPKEEAQHKIIVCHGYENCKDMDLPISQEVLEELKVYLLLYDRAGYYESDPNPSRSVKTEAFDIQELADRLELALSQHSFEKLPKSYKRTYTIAYYTPWLINWWMTQKWFPVLEREGMSLISDLTISTRMLELPGLKNALRQGEHESIHRDLVCTYGKWEFDPMELTNPFPDNKGSVHMWQGSQDRVVPIELNRFIAQKLPWIQYHELPNYGHLLIHEPPNFELILRALLVVDPNCAADIHQ